MQSSLIGKIEKAKRYAHEKDRVTFNELSVKFHGRMTITTSAIRTESGIAPAPFSPVGIYAAIPWL